MTNGGFIFFKNTKDKNNAIKILNNLYCFDKKIFEIKNYKNKSIFYKINLKSKNFINKNYPKYEENYIRQSLEEISSYKKNRLNKKNINYFFLENIAYIKTTGSHVREGIVLCENFDIIKKKLVIPNHRIFNYICKHFKI